ncbi:type II secretion system GspH family protein [Candidatus Parcubacteria bacterium]|nr:type II secretion system GspH family protein [Candidatus Parcubacteria bacterium]
MKNIPSRRGFTLVETLVAISVLLTALVGPMTIAARGVFTAGVARDQVTAYFLAQEAMEYVRAVRDGNGLASLNTDPQSPSWLTGLATYCESTYCYVDAKNNSVASCSSTHASCPALKLDTSVAANPFYVHGGSYSDSPFKRSVRLEQVSADEEKVTVTVTWMTGGLSKTVTLVDQLNNWQTF